MKRLLRFAMLVSAFLVAVLGAVAYAGVGAKKSAAQESAFSAESFYGVLVGEMSARRGDAASAYRLMLDAARKTESAALYERALMFAFATRRPEIALQVAQEWAQAFPDSMRASVFVLQILVEMNRTGQTLKPLQQILASANSQERLQSIEMLPRFYAPATDKKLAANLVEQALAPDLKSPSTGPMAWTSIGLLRLAAKDVAGALDAARRGSQLNASAQGPILLALYLTEPTNDEAHNQEAHNLVQQFLANNQPGPSFRMAYVRKLLDMRRLGEAYTQVQLLTSQSPTLAEAWLIRGSLELQDKKFTQAEASLQTYVSLNTAQSQAADEGATDTGLVHAYLMLSEIAMRSNKLEQARVYLDRISSTQDVLRVQSQRAMLLARQGKLAQARALLRDMPQSQAIDARAKLKAEVQLLREYKKYPEAYQLLKQARVETSKDVDLLYDLATLAEKLGNLQEMEDLLRRVIAMQPDYYAAYNALGYAFAGRNMRLAEARELIQKALKFAPQDPYILDSLAWVEFRSGNLPEALRLLQSAYQARPDAEIAAHLGEVLWMMGDKKQALEIWSQGNRLNPENETLVETLLRFPSKL